MITVIATLRVLPGKGSQFEDDFRSWAGTVKDNEPGTLEYSLSRDRDDQDLYYALELYADQQAVEMHMANLHAREGVPNLLAASPEIRLLDRIV